MVLVTLMLVVLVLAWLGPSGLGVGRSMPFALQAVSVVFVAVLFIALIYVVGRRW